MRFEELREGSLRTAERLGFAVSPSLPLLDVPEQARSAQEIGARLLCLQAAAASAYGLDRRKARQWLDQEGLTGDLTSSERDFIDRAIGETTRFKLQVEGMWALAWALGLVQALDFARDCENTFA